MNENQNEWSFKQTAPSAPSCQHRSALWAEGRAFRTSKGGKVTLWTKGVEIWSETGEGSAVAPSERRGRTSTTQVGPTDRWFINKKETADYLFICIYCNSWIEVENHKKNKIKYK
jgi:hypothetical protein